MPCHYVIGVRMDNRVHNAVAFQEVLTKNGCILKARLGLHEASDNACSNDGLIILQPCGSQEEIEQLVKDINSLEGTKAKFIDLNTDK